MKTAKPYRPRRGIRFTNGRRGVSPAAGFIGSDAIKRTRPGPPDGVSEFTVSVSGDVARSISGSNASYEPFSPAILSSSVLIEGSISKGRNYERRKLNSILLGQSVTSVDATPYPSAIVIDANPTGSFIIPSWTHSSIGFNQAFVGVSLSSSHQARFSYNAFQSSSQALESSDSSAFFSPSFSKESRFSTIVVKKTASFFDSVITQFNSSSRGGTYSPPLRFVSGLGTLVSSINNPGLDTSQILTGSSVYYPSVITLDVPVSGRLVDIKVWVELQHESSSVANLLTPLGTLGISLRSPNVQWGWSVPIDNDLRIKDLSTNRQFYPRIAVGGPYQAEFWRDSFVLWEGPGLLGDDRFGIGATETSPSTPFSSANAGNPKWRSMFAGWDRDIGMRTVFSDGSPIPNPRMNYSAGDVSGNFVGSPNGTCAWGLGVSWTGSSGSPPNGWLSGPGGTANVNEWPTTGTNTGASSIRPMYPLLDPIFQKIPNVPGVTYPTFIDTVVDGVRIIDPATSLVGFRPGLRGTEISGTWQLMFAVNGLFSFGDTRTDPSTKFNVWFRQARLEITYETGRGGSRFERRLPSTAVRDQQIYSVSGVIGTNEGGIFTASLNVFTPLSPQGSIGRSFGIEQNSGSVDMSNALIYRLSGALSNIVGSTPPWLFSGPGGIPVLPESSATLVPLVAEPVRSIPFSDFLQPRRTLDQTQALPNVAADINPQKSLRDLAISYVSSSLG